MRDTLDSTKVYLHIGGNPDDNKWKIYEAGWYHVVLNLDKNTISYKRLSLYVVGDGTPTGWNIATPEPMTNDAANPAIFTWTGALTAGEMKFSEFTGNWCDGDWIQSSVPNQVLTATDYIITHGCDGPDNKWLIKSGEEGTYTVTINLAAQTIGIVKQ